MTTNAGAAQHSMPAIGFGNQTRQKDAEDIINKLFTPEFRNRLDAIIPFKILSLNTILKVVEKFINQLEAKMSERSITVAISEKAKEKIAQEGYDTEFGARPIQRLVQEKIKKPLSDELLFGELSAGDHIDIVIKNGDIVTEVKYFSENKKVKNKKKQVKAK